MKQSFAALCSQYRELCGQQRALDCRIACCRNHLALLQKSDRYSDTLLVEPARRHTEMLQSTAQELSSKALRLAEEIRLRTHRLPDARLCDLLEYRYIDGMPWSQISGLLGLELRWVMRLHRRAVQQLDSAAEKSLPA